MSREGSWMKRRCGMITASELGDIVSAKGGIIETNLSYIRKKRWERRHGFAHHISNWAMEMGNEQEPYIFKWLVENNPGLDAVYSKDLPEIPFWIAPDCPLGASPDAYTEDERVVFEFKTLTSGTTIEYFADEDTSYEEKKVTVWKDHGDQLLGQFISNPKVEEIWLVKYIYCDDDILEDTDSPVAPWRGIVFKFKRSDFEESIEAMKERVRLFDAMIDAHVNPSDFKKGDWAIVDGNLVKNERPSK